MPIVEFTSFTICIAIIEQHIRNFRVQLEATMTKQAANVSNRRSLIVALNATLEVFMDTLGSVL